MVNSSFIHFVDEESVHLATPYMISEGKPREVSWRTFSDMGENSWPGGSKQAYIVCKEILSMDLT